MPHSLAPVGGVCARMLDCSLFKPAKKGGKMPPMGDGKRGGRGGGGGVVDDFCCACIRMTRWVRIRQTPMKHGPPGRKRVFMAVERWLGLPLKGWLGCKDAKQSSLPSFPDTVFSHGTAFASFSRSAAAGGSTSWADAGPVVADTPATPPAGHRTTRRACCGRQSMAPDMTHSADPERTKRRATPAATRAGNSAGTATKRSATAWAYLSLGLRQVNPRTEMESASKGEVPAGLQPRNLEMAWQTVCRHMACWPTGCPHKGCDGFMPS